MEAEKLDLNRKGNEAAVASEHIVWCGVVCGAVCGELPQCVCVVNCCGAWCAGLTVLFSSSRQ